MAERRDIPQTQIIGDGSTVIALVSGIEKTGGLYKFVSPGLVVVGENAHLGGGRLNQYKGTETNSPGGDFWRGFRQTGTFERSLLSGSGQRLKEADDQLLPLDQVGEFFNDAGRDLEALIRDCPAAEMHPNQRIRKVEMIGGKFVSVNSRGEQVAASENIVFATGASPRLPEEYLPFEDRVVFAEKVLSGGSDEVQGRLAGGLRLAAIAPSHSTLAALGRLEREVGTDILKGTALFQRGPIKLFYGSESAALQDGYRYETQDVCPDTGRVGRFGGVRGRAAEIGRALVKSGGDIGWLKTVSIETVGADGLDLLLQNAGVVLVGCGYQVNEVPIYRDGKQIGPKIDIDGQAVVGPNSELYDDSGNVIDGAFGAGLGYGIRTNGTFGEPGFKGRLDGFNITQERVAPAIFQGIQRRNVVLV